MEYQRTSNEKAAPFRSDADIVLARLTSPLTEEEFYGSYVSDSRGIFLLCSAFLFDKDIVRAVV